MVYREISEYPSHHQIFIFKLLSPLFLGPLKKMKPIHSKKVAKAMIKITNGDFKQNVFESNEIAVSYTHLTLPTTPYV